MKETCKDCKFFFKKNLVIQIRPSVDIDTLACGEFIKDSKNET